MPPTDREAQARELLRQLTWCIVDDPPLDEPLPLDAALPLLLAYGDRCRTEAQQRERVLWVCLVYSLGLADHLGDACNDLRQYAALAGLPMPPDDAELEEWVTWGESQGADHLYSDTAKAAALPEPPA